MTKKHFQMIAETINAEWARAASDVERITLRSVAIALSVKLAGTNPAFNRRRFLVACGVVSREA